MPAARRRCSLPRSVRYIEVYVEKARRIRQLKQALVQQAADLSELCQQTQCRPEVVFEANSIIGAAELCGAGLGATFVTDMLARSWQRKEVPFFFELEEPVETRQLVAAYGCHQRLSQVAKIFLTLLRPPVAT